MPAKLLRRDRGVEIIDKIKSLEGTSAPPKDYVNRLYGILTVLDAKASGLLGVNSLFLTVLVFFIGWSNAPAGFPSRFVDFVPLAYFDAVLLVISSFLCLLVVTVSWKFMSHAILNEGEYHFDMEIVRLANVVHDRTHYYWWAWLCTLVTLLLSFAWAFAFVRRTGTQILRAFFG